MARGEEDTLMRLPNHPWWKGVFSWTIKLHRCEIRECCKD